MRNSQKQHRIRHGRALRAAVLGLCLVAGNAQAEVFEESFDHDPTSHGWIVHGEASLAAWDPVERRLAMTWDSGSANSYLALPLGQTLSRASDFEFSFDLTLLEHRIGTNPVKPGTFPIAAGFLNLDVATEAGFIRGSGTGTPNLVEWTWFAADSAISASISPVITSTNRPPRWAFRDSYIELQTGVVNRVHGRYTASDSTLRFTHTLDGAPGPEILPVVLPANFTDFHVNAFSFTSYSDVGQDPRYAGSVLARGWIDNVRLVLPENPQPVLRMTAIGQPRGVIFKSRKGWSYTLLSSHDLEVWTELQGPIDGTGGDLTLLDLRKALFPQQFYRVRAQQP
jgi:hypothetical protein